MYKNRRSSVNSSGRSDRKQKRDHQLVGKQNCEEEHGVLFTPKHQEQSFKYPGRGYVTGNCDVHKAL